MPGNDCIFGPRHGINSKNPYYHPSICSTAIHDGEITCFVRFTRNPLPRDVDFRKSFRSFSRESVDVSTEAARLRGTLNGIVNYDALTFGPTIINVLWSARAHTVFAVAAVITRTVQTARL